MLIEFLRSLVRIRLVGSTFLYKQKKEKRGKKGRRENKKSREREEKRVRKLGSSKAKWDGTEKSKKSIVV